MQGSIGAFAPRFLTHVSESARQAHEIKLMRNASDTIPGFAGQVVEAKRLVKGNSAPGVDAT